MKRLNQQGYNLVELAIAVAILAALASSVMLARSFVAKQTVATTDKSYATQKAVQMFEELKALVNGSEKTGVNVLDQYSDGSLYNTILTTDKVVDTGLASANPGDPLSGNRTTNGHWRYLRQIQVKRVANDPYTRQVFVKVYLYGSDANPGEPGVLLAEVGGILRTITSLYPPTQVMDVYAIDINNIAAWWAQEPTLYATFQACVTDIAARNPGFEIRPHYITRTSYGRDPQYIPYINQKNTAGTVNVTDQTGVLGGIIPSVYFYPGSTPQDPSPGGCGCEQSFYDPSASGIQVDGNFNVDGTDYYTSSQFTGCPSYSVADQFNNAMRYPDELAAYNQVLAAAAADPNLGAGSPITEISYRMLLEDMLSEPQSFTNALIVNLHGELLPLPPLRNYSDPAKDPAGSVYGNDTGVRVVTHPEKIYYPAIGTASVTLRTYSYYDGFDDMTQLGTTPAYTASASDPRLNAISVFLPDVTLPSSSVIIHAIVGSASVTYSNDLLTAGTPDNGMSYTVSNPVGGGTSIVLSGSPLRCPQFTSPTGNNSGLNSANRLYETEYIPCPVDGASFTKNLTDTTVNSPKNTARWIITLNNVPTGQHAIETAIGTTNNYAAPNPPPNLSKTYVWVGTAPPYTERYQFMGDPRDCPYLDMHTGSADGVIEANSYNWYFKDLNGTVDGYSGFSQAGAVTGWGGDNNNVDVPRFYEMVRGALLKTTSIWTTMNGFSYYYFGFGGEMGSDQPPYSNGITINGTPWQTTATKNLTTVAEMINYQGVQNSLRVVSTTNDKWYAKTWRGELYPDSMYGTWASTGNLPVAGAATDGAHFYRKLLGSVATTGSIDGFGRDTTDRTGPPGCTSFFNGAFTHDTNGAAATLMSLGSACYNLFQYPLAESVSCTREWKINGSYSTPSEWSISPYNIHNTLSNPAIGGLNRIFYDYTGSGSDNATGVVQITDASGNVAYVVESGLAISSDVGTPELGKTALVFMLRTFLDGGRYAVAGQPGHILQVPLVHLYVDSPNSQYNQPSNINIVVSGAVTTGNPITVAGTAISSGPLPNVWYRFPGLTSATANYYTEEYLPVGGPITASSYAETLTTGVAVTLDCNIKYSSDQGGSWFFIQDNNPAQFGILDTSPAHLIRTNTFPISYSWPVPAGSFPQGDYLIMVEAYRSGYPLDYAYQQLDVSINR